MPRSAPSSAAELLPEIRAANNSLIQAFEAHPQFAPQHSRRQGKIYFMWDFAKRTSAMFDSILQDLPPPDTPATRGSIPNVPPSSMSQRQKKELRDDAVGRCVMLHSMITDTSGMAGMMFGEVPGQGVDVGEAVRAASNNVEGVLFGRQQGTAQAATQ